MKRLNKYIVLFMASATFFSCNKDDDNNPTQNPLLGKWEVTDGIFLESQPKYLIFNTDNTVSFLSQEVLEFKTSYDVAYTLPTESTIELNVQGFVSFEYTLDQNTLNITREGLSTLQLTKNNSAPNANDWITELSVLSEGNTPWSGEVDIAFTHDKTKIVYGMNATATYIPLISPTTFTEVGQIATTNSAKVVEIENFAVPDRYLFQSNDDSAVISVYTFNNGAYQFNLDADSDISGMASIDSQFLWVASNNNEGRLMLIDVADNTILQTLSMNNRSVNGLDYQNGYLYVADGEYLHKCQTTPTFKAVNTYKVPNFDLSGVAFDGVNFWANGYDETNSYKLIKTSLTL